MKPKCIFFSVPIFSFAFALRAKQEEEPKRTTRTNQMRKPQPPGRPAGGGFGVPGTRTTHSQLLTVLSFLACLYVAGR